MQVYPDTSKREVIVAFCGNCGTAQSGKFCGKCGAPGTQVALSQQPAYAPPTYIQPAMYTNSQPIPITMQGGVAVRLGGTCPKCRAHSYSTKYSFAHFLICVCLFPFGLLCLLAPVKHCNGCGNEYGLGAFLRSMVWFIVGFFIFAFIVLGVMMAGHN